MASVLEQLSNIFGSEVAQALARFSPLGLVALVSGGALDAASADLPLATRATHPILALSGNDRAAAIQRGLEAHDPQVQALVAELLVAFAPQLAATLATRPTQLAALRDGMQRGGGQLADLAPRLAAALANPHADWAALQRQQTRRSAAVEMAIEASDGSVVRGNTQRAERSAGPVSLRIVASGRSTVEHNTQVAAPGGAAAAPRPAPPGAPAPQEHLRKLLAITEARRRIRELQRAQYGIDVPPHIQIELDDLLQEEVRLRGQIGDS